MDFALSSEHEMVQKMVRDFARKEVYPGIKEADRNQQMDPGVLPRMGELGIMGICIPVRYGGQGMDYIALGLACEELEDPGAYVVGVGGAALRRWTERVGEFDVVDVASGESVAA